MNKALQLLSLYGNFTIAVSWRGSHYLCCLCLWKQWSLYGHMGIVLSPSRPIPMFYLTICVISRLNNYTNTLLLVDWAEKQLTCDHEVTIFD